MRSRDLRGRLLQVNQRRDRSIGRYRFSCKAATIRRGRSRRWLLLSDKTGHANRAILGRSRPGADIVANRRKQGACRAVQIRLVAYAASIRLLRR